MDEQPRSGQKLPASDCGRIASQLEAAMAKFLCAGLPADRKGPVPQAINTLRDVAQRSAYGATDAELLAVTAAVRVARDYCGIANAMPDKPDDAYRAELGRIFYGGLHRGDYRESHDIRAQLAFAARLSAAGHSPRLIPTGNDKTPDYLLPIGSREFGLEVKRPATLARTVKKLDEGASQLRAIATPGFIALDLSRLYGAMEETPTPRGDSATLRQEMHEAFWAHTVQLAVYCERQAFNPMKRDKFSYVIGACCFVEIPHWMADDRSAPVLLTLHTGGPVMWSSVGRNLWQAAATFSDTVSRIYTGRPYQGIPILIPPEMRRRRPGNME